MLAHILRTDHHLHRRLPEVSERAAAVKVLARQHQEAIWAWHQAVSRLRSVLLEFYPQALKAFPNLKHHAATTVLAAAPSPAAARSLTRRRVVTLLRQCGRRCDPELIEKIITTLRTDELRQPNRVENAYAATVTGLLPVLVSLREAVSQLEEALAAEFTAHPFAHVLTSAPGLGPVLGARLLAEIGDDPTRFASADGLRAFAGTAPVTRASGRSRWVVARKVP